MLIASVGMAAEPQEDIEISIDGKTIDSEVPPRIQDGRTLVPARFVFEPLGVEMGWDGDTRVASGVLGDQRVEMPIGSREAKVNGEIEMLDVSAQIFEGRTYIPLRFAGEAFDRKVSWDGETRSITVDEMILMYTEEKWEEISNLAYSPNGDTVAVGAREVELFSVEDREIIASGVDMDHGDRPESNSLDFSSDGSILGAAWTGVSLHDAEDLTKLLHLHGGGDCRIAFSPDGKMLATHPTQNDSEVWLWEIGNNLDFEKVAEFTPEGRMTHDIEFTPDGNYIAGGFRDGIVRIWDVETHELVNTIDFDTTGGHYNLSFSPDGEVLAASDPDLGRGIYLYEWKDGTLKRTLEPEGRISSMEFSPDGRKLAYGMYGGGVEIMNIAGEEIEIEDWSKIYSFEQEDTVRGLSFGPDSRKLAIGTDSGNLYLYGYPEN